MDDEVITSINKFDAVVKKKDNDSIFKILHIQLHIKIGSHPMCRVIFS